MTASENSTSLGDEVLRDGVDAARAVLGPDLAAVFALGSLAHGGFAPLVSDVDLMIVVDGTDVGTADRIAEVQHRVRTECVNELVSRLSVFWSDWPGVRHGVGPFGRLPEVDRLDLLESGRLLHGVDRRAGAVVPQPAVLIRQAAEFAVDRFDVAYTDKLATPAMLIAGGARPVTKAVLFPVRFLYTLETGRIGRNDDAANWFVATHERHGSLVAAALNWRFDGLGDPTAEQSQLADHLIPVYEMFVREYRQAMEVAGEGALAHRLDLLGQRLRSASGGVGDRPARDVSTAGRKAL